MKKVIVLLSGGMDSTTVLGLIKKEKLDVLALGFDYGQKHKTELKNAKKIAKYYDVPFKILKLNFAQFFNKETVIYKGKKIISDDYLPFRNMIIFAITCGYAESKGYSEIYYGANADDVFPDNLKPFLIEFNKSLKSMETKIRLKYPLVNLSKKQVVELANKLKVPLELTRSCYLNQVKSCGKCLACKKRLEGFKKAKISDKIDYC